MSEASFIDTIMAGGASSSDTSELMKLLVDPKGFNQLKMVSDISPELTFVDTVMSVIQWRFSSSVLRAFQSNLYRGLIAKDRKGRGEIIEAYLGLRRLAEDSD